MPSRQLVHRCCPSNLHLGLASSHFILRFLQTSHPVRTLGEKAFLRLDGSNMLQQWLRPAGWPIWSRNSSLTEMLIESLQPNIRNPLPKTVFQLPDDRGQQSHLYSAEALKRDALVARSLTSSVGRWQRSIFQATIKSVRAQR